MVRIVLLPSFSVRSLHTLSAVLGGSLLRDRTDTTDRTADAACCIA